MAVITPEKLKERARQLQRRWAELTPSETDDPTWKHVRKALDKLPTGLSRHKAYAVRVLHSLARAQVGLDDKPRSVVISAIELTKKVLLELKATPAEMRV